MPRCLPAAPQESRQVLSEAFGLLRLQIQFGGAHEEKGQSQRQQPGGQS